MGNTISNPYSAFVPKTTPGKSDVSIVNNVYKFMGASIISVNMNLGFNGTASSISITLIEDKDNGDSFQEPTIPSLWGFSLPKGGPGQPIFHTSYNFDQESFYGANVPFYFAGICTNWSRNEIDIGGKTITVTLTDTREILSGVQCIINGFALSENVVVTGVDNVIDVFRYWDHGFDSGKNQYGIPWNKIKTAISDCRVRLYDMYFEFVFTGAAFINTPDWYRIEEDTMDVMSLLQKVAQDGGSDIIINSRKIDNSVCMVEIQGLKRTDFNPITEQEIHNFVAARTDIVESCRIGKEFRNEATSSIIIGGPKNSMYVAWPSAYDRSMHLVDGTNYENINLFPTDLKVRLFGGSAELLTGTDDLNDLGTENKDFNIKSGAIFPFWGYTPDDIGYPLIEPVLPLDHLVFDRTSDELGRLKSRIPLIRLAVKNFSVRNIKHSDMFLDGDGDADDRPFAYLAEYIISNDNIAGYMRGLPLNTEVLRSALISQEAFESTYCLFYPDIAESMLLPRPAFGMLLNSMKAGTIFDLKSVDISKYIYNDVGSENDIVSDPTPIGKILKANMDDKVLRAKACQILSNYRAVIYQQVRQYALDHVGKKFLVCLPKSETMQRIWNNQPVPTIIERPEIEYTVDQKGYWENLPTEFDGVSSDNNTAQAEQQIRRKFMAEDGRFVAMVAMDWQPTGNVNFNSNGINRAMFQDLPVSEFRPNEIANNHPNYVFISCNVIQLPRRPDLALVEIPSPVQFDPTDASSTLELWLSGNQDDEFIMNRSGLLRFFAFWVQKSNSLRAALKLGATNLSQNTRLYTNRVINKWANDLSVFYQDAYRLVSSTECVMDLKTVIIPLTSTRVSYGPWYAPYGDAAGMVKMEVDLSLVPWNFPRSTTKSFGTITQDGIQWFRLSDDEWAKNLNIAGEERLQRSYALVKRLDTANIVVAGFPEYGIGNNLGFNSNITSISTDFGLGGVKTTYNISTFGARPGTYRKSDYDNISKALIDTRLPRPDVVNINAKYDTYDGTNRFN